jgi:hypothetical protein
MGGQLDMEQRIDRFDKKKVQSNAMGCRRAK